MRIEQGFGKTQYGPGVNIDLTGDELATAIDAYLVAHGVHVSGPRTVFVNGDLCRSSRVYVDPCGYVCSGGEIISAQLDNDPSTKRA